MKIARAISWKSNWYGLEKMWWNGCEFFFSPKMTNADWRRVGGAKISSQSKVFFWKNRPKIQSGDSLVYSLEILTYWSTFHVAAGIAIGCCHCLVDQWHCLQFKIFSQEMVGITAIYTVPLTYTTKAGPGILVTQYQFTRQNTDRTPTEFEPMERF